MKELKVGTWIAYPNKLGQSEYGRFIKKVYRMHKFKTELELEKVNGVHAYKEERHREKKAHLFQVPQKHNESKYAKYLWESYTFKCKEVVQ